mgnify:CR=1 FL=1
MISVPGSWKSLEDLEDNITLDELTEIIQAHRKQRFEDRKFMASLQGHEMQDGNDGGGEDAFTRAKRRAVERLEKERVEQGGLSNNDMELSSIGIAVIKE